MCDEYVLQGKVEQQQYKINQLEWKLKRISEILTSMIEDGKIDISPEELNIVKDYLKNDIL